MNTFLSHSAEETERFGQQLAGQLSAGTITLSYHFDGKTWVMDSKSAKELALALSSPT